MGFLPTLSTATLALSVLYTGSNAAKLIERQALGPPATLPAGWSYKGCYTYDMLYPCLVLMQDNSLDPEILTDDHAETPWAEELCRTHLLRATVKALMLALTSVLRLDTA